MKNEGEIVIGGDDGYWRVIRDCDRYVGLLDALSSVCRSGRAKRIDKAN